MLESNALTFFYCFFSEEIFIRQKSTTIRGSLDEILEELIEKQQEEVGKKEKPTQQAEKLRNSQSYIFFDISRQRKEEEDTIQRKADFIKQLEDVLKEENLTISIRHCCNSLASWSK